MVDAVISQLAEVKSSWLVTAAREPVCGFAQRMAAKLRVSHYHDEIDR
jgi:hypothetical protein